MTPDQTKVIAAFLHALSAPTRVGIVRLLAAGEASVSDLAAGLGERMSLLSFLSFHLNLLRSAGVAESRRDGRFIRYQLAGAEVTRKAVTFTRGVLTVTLDR